MENSKFLPLALHQTPKPKQMIKELNIVIDFF